MLFSGQKRLCGAGGLAGAKSTNNNQGINHADITHGFKREIFNLSLKGIKYFGAFVVPRSRCRGIKVNEAAWHQTEHVESPNSRSGSRPIGPYPPIGTVSPLLLSNTKSGAQVQSIGAQE